MKTHRLRLTSLKFISSVDVPAQQTAVARLLKRANGIQVTTTARAVKFSDELGLVFGWALTTKANGAEYFDLQGDNIVEDDLIKVAAAFMEAGGAADTMHDRQRDGRVVFAMPLTAEVAKAFGIETDTHGLMVALRPSAEDFAKFKTGELTGFSIDGMGERTAVDKKARRRARKEAVLTSETDGHQHALDLDDPASAWSAMYSTSYQTMEGAEDGHSHSWTFDKTSGVITIGTDSGHTHTVAAVIPADALAAWAKLDAARDAENAAISAAPVAVVDAPSDGIPMACADEDSSGKVQVVVVSARAPATKSTPLAAAPTVKPQPETTKMNLAKMLATILAMTASQQDYLSKLAPDELEPFLGKPSNERDAIFKSAASADPIIFTGEVTKVEVRKSDGELALKMAMQAEHSAVELAKAQAEVATEKAARETVELTKRAGETLGALAGETGTHVAILRAVETIGDAAVKAAAIVTLKAANAAMVAKSKAAGGSGSEDAAPFSKKAAYTALSAGLATFCAEQKITKMWTDGLAAFGKTPAGAELISQHAEASK